MGAKFERLCRLVLSASRQRRKLWHVSSRGNNRADIFFDDDDRLAFLALLAEAVVRFRWLLHAYTLMTNHFHLVIETPEKTLSRGMKWLKQSYAQRVNKKYKRSGHLFERRFDAQLIERESYLLNVLRYTVLNPVRAHMVERPEDYRWSSYRATAGYEAVPAWLTTSWTLAQFGTEVEAQQREYRAWVDAGASIERSPFEDLVGQFFLGTRSWIERMQAITDSEPRSSEHPAKQRYAGRPTARQVIDCVAEVFNDTTADIRARHGGQERMLVAWLCCYESNETNGEVAAALLLRSSSRITALVKECDAAMRIKPLLQIARDRCVDLLRKPLEIVPVMHREMHPGVSLHQ